jgi:mannosyl-oligosaccharide alpha-1,2-mannosidase
MKQLAWTVQPLLLIIVSLVAFVEFLLIMRLELKEEELTTEVRESVRAHPRFPFGADMPHPYHIDTSKFTDRQWAVVEAIRHAWKGYKECALGHDELITDGWEVDIDGSGKLVQIPYNCTWSDWGEPAPPPAFYGGGDWSPPTPAPTPIPGREKEEIAPFTGIALTLIESLDTLWLAGERKEFYFAVDWLRRHHTWDVSVDVSLFETTIRLLGGLISAYELSGEPTLLDSAYDLGDRLMAAWRGEELVPLATVNLKYRTPSHPTWLGTTTSLSEITTIQIEFKKLSYWSGDDRFDRAAARIMPLVFNGVADTPLGLPSAYINRYTGSFESRSSVVTLGARGDSFYEYVVKLWWLTNKTERRYEIAYSNLRDAIGNNLIVQVEDERFFIAEAEYFSGRRIFKMDHLACFASGMFLLGRDTMKKKFYNRDTELAVGVGEMCHEMYTLSNTGLGPEIVKFGPAPKYEMYFGAFHYILRPEALEAMFYLRRFTKETRWRDFAWKMFRAIEDNLKMKNGYSGVHNVSRNGNETLSYNFKMESFFMAETLKYALLSQEDPHLSEDDQMLPFRDWVFNTEAHPVRVYDPRSSPLLLSTHDTPKKKRPKTH